MKLSRVLQFLHQGSLRVHCSQHCEHVMLHEPFGYRQSAGFYFDSGAHHPFRRSSTACLWLRALNGVTSDASRTVINLCKRVRPRALWIETAQKDIHAHLNPHACHILERAGPLLTDRMGLSAIFQRQDG